MGTVYKASKVGEEQLVAIKVLFKEVSSKEGYVLRFQREGRVLGLANDHFSFMETPRESEMADEVKRTNPIVKHAAKSAPGGMKKPTQAPGKAQNNKTTAPGAGSANTNIAKQDETVEKDVWYWQIPPGGEDRHSQCDDQSDQNAHHIEQHRRGRADQQKRKERLRGNRILC